MNDYSKITALYSRLSVGDEDRDGGESNSIQNQKKFLESYARQLKLTNIRHYIDDDESGRFFDRSAYSRMIEDVENGKIGVCIMKDMTRWGRDYLQVGNAMEIFRRNNVRFIAVNNGIDSEKPDTLEFAPFINIMSEWYARDISKKVKTGIRTKGTSGKPIATEAPYGYVKDPDNKDFWIIDEEAAKVVRLIFRLFLNGKNRNQIAVYLKNEQIPTPTFYMKDRGRGTCKNKALNEENRCKWNKATLTHILMLFVTLPTPNYSKIPQIKRRYSIIHSDEYYVRLFYPAPSVIISKPLSTKEAGTSPSKVWFPASFSHHSNSYGLQNYDNHICRRKQSLNAKFL